MLILIVIIIGGISLYLYIKYDYSEKATIDSNNLITTAPCMITTNIAWHDSICKREGIKGLFSAYFDDIWFTPCYNENSVLSLSEQRYVIYVLLQHGLSVRRDCESGDIYINRSATLKN